MEKQLAGDGVLGKALRGKTLVHVCQLMGMTWELRNSLWMEDNQEQNPPREEEKWGPVAEWRETVGAETVFCYSRKAGR